jgi:tetratricopeptide (TPR) repeat protein
MATLLFIALIGLPAIAFVLWPLLRGRTASAGVLAIPSADDREEELNEAKLALYRALKEIEFDFRAGHLSDEDYQALRARYEGRAAQVLKELDQLAARRPRVKPEAPAPSRPRIAREARPWTRSPLAIMAGAIVLVIFGLALGLGVARYTEPDRTMVPPGSRLPVPIEAQPPLAATPGAGSAPARPIAPEMLAGMLQAARASLFEGRYQEAIAAYQAVLKRDPRNADAMTHLALIVAIGGHSDAALESLARALAIDPNYPPAYLYRGQILYDAKQDYPGAVEAWEKFVALVPRGEETARVTRLIQEAKGRLLKPQR